MVFAHPPTSLAPIRTRQESIQSIGYEIFKEQREGEGEITLPLLSRTQRGVERIFFENFRKIFSAA
jgi:hypothetical protein